MSRWFQRKESRKLAAPREREPYKSIAALATKVQEARQVTMIPAPKPKLIERASTWPKENVKGDSLGVLLRMLSTKRPYQSATCAKFCRDWIEPLGAKRDAMGNWILRIGNAPVLWSCHTDSVHYKEGLQRLNYQPGTGMLGLARRSLKDSNCLGADDGAGVWLMREMILAKRPGLYIFHAGEERGGIGSSFIAKHTPEVLTGIRAAIAFDRKATQSIITHQGWNQRCCSDEFAESLSRELGMNHMADSGGVYTDTKEYAGLVQECSNISVGYYSEHTKEESLDVPYLFALRDAMLRVDSERLTIKREASESDELEFEYCGGAYAGSYGGRFESSYTGGSRGYAGASFSNRAKLALDDDYDAPYTRESSRRSIVADNAMTDALARMVRDNPDLIVELLEDYGIDAVEVADWIHENRGIVPPEMLAMDYEDSQ